MHLTELTYRHLLHRTLPPAESRRFAAHLRVDCGTCEQFLGQREAADALDGRVDAVLASLAKGISGAGNDLEYARIMRRVAAAGAASARAPAVAPGRARRRLLPTLALAATVAVAGLAGLLVSRSPPGGATRTGASQEAGWDGLKGAAQPVPLRLRFVVLTSAVGGPPAIEKGVSGQEVPSDASLQFQVELGRAAEVVLARVGAAGAQDVFFRSRLPAGRSAVTVAGQPAAYPLAALAGPQRFLALASEAPIDPAEVARAAAQRAGAGPDAGQAISLDQVEVRVLPSMGR